MITEEDITAALELIDEASPGPARWTNPCTGVDRKLFEQAKSFAEQSNIPLSQLCEAGLRLAIEAKQAETAAERKPVRR